MGTCKKCGKVVGVLEMQNGYCTGCLNSISINNVELDLNNMKRDLLDTTYKIFNKFATKEEIESIFHIIFEYKQLEAIYKPIETIIKQNNTSISSPSSHFLVACEKITGVVGERIPSTYVAREFVLQDLEGASLGAKTRTDVKDFLDNSGFTPKEYMNSNKNEDPLIDGINGPQQFLNFFIGPFISEMLDKETNAQFRMCIIDNIMKKYKLGKYAQNSDESIDSDAAKINESKTISEPKESNDYISSVENFKNEREIEYSPCLPKCMRIFVRVNILLFPIIAYVYILLVNLYISSEDFQPMRGLGALLFFFLPETIIWAKILVSIYQDKRNANYSELKNWYRFYFIFRGLILFILVGSNDWRLSAIGISAFAILPSIYYLYIFYKFKDEKNYHLNFKEAVLSITTVISLLFILFNGMIFLEQKLYTNYYKSQLKSVEKYSANEDYKTIYETFCTISKFKEIEKNEKRSTLPFIVSDFNSKEDFLSFFSEYYEEVFSDCKNNNRYGLYFDSECATNKLNKFGRKNNNCIINTSLMVIKNNDYNYNDYASLLFKEGRKNYLYVKNNKDVSTRYFNYSQIFKALSAYAQNNKWANNYNYDICMLDTNKFYNYCEKELRLEDNPYFLFNIGDKLKKTSRSEKAIAFYKAGCQDESYTSNCIEIAEKLESEYKIKDAISLYDIACDNNSSKACSTLGEMYFLGNNITYDLENSKKYMKKACDLKDKKACEIYKMLKTGKGDIVEANKCKYFTCKDKNSPIHNNQISESKKVNHSLFEGKDTSIAKIYNSFSQLGAMRSNKNKVKEDVFKSFSINKEACIGGNPQSCYNVGQMYYSGKGTRQNYKKSIDFFNKTCNGGEPWGCYMLGFIYEKGQGTTVDYKKAKIYYGKACDGQNSKGCTAYSRLNRR